MKTLFLDIDGVLNSGQYVNKVGKLFDNPAHQMDPEAIERLNRFTDLTGVKIVVSSTWRYAFVNEPNGLEMLQDCIKSYGITAEVVGMTTIDIYAATDRRGQEIAEWIDDHYQEIDSFVIIDDDSDMGRLSKFHVKTEWEEGLLDTHLEQMEAALKASENWL